MTHESESESYSDYSMMAWMVVVSSLVLAAASGDGGTSHPLQFALCSRACTRIH
jgi:hypothetical protein